MTPCKWVTFLLIPALPPSQVSCDPADVTFLFFPALPPLPRPKLLRLDLYIIGRFCLSVTFLLIYGSRSVFMGIHGSRLVIHSSRLVLMVFIGSRLVFHVSRLVVHGFS